MGRMLASRSRHEYEPHHQDLADMSRSGRMRWGPMNYQRAALNNRIVGTHCIPEEPLIYALVRRRIDVDFIPYAPPLI